MRYVDLETAKALQELGYDGEFQHYHVNACDEGYETITIADYKECESDINNQCAAPRFEDVAYWMRDKYGIFPTAATPNYSYRSAHTFDFYYSILENIITGWWHRYSGGPYPNYETALEDAVKKAIQIIKDIAK